MGGIVRHGAFVNGHSLWLPFYKKSCSLTGLLILQAEKLVLQLLILILLERHLLLWIWELLRELVYCFLHHQDLLIVCLILWLQNKLMVHLLFSQGQLKLFLRLFLFLLMNQFLFFKCLFKSINFFSLSLEKFPIAVVRVGGGFVFWARILPPLETFCMIPSLRLLLLDFDLYTLVKAVFHI